jgi:hypothetical protein
VYGHEVLWRSVHWLQFFENLGLKGDHIETDFYCLSNQELWRLSMRFGLHRDLGVNYFELEGECLKQQPARLDLGGAFLLVWAPLGPEPEGDLVVAKSLTCSEIIEQVFNLATFNAGMAEDVSKTEVLNLKEALALKLTDQVGFLFSLGRLSEENGLPTVSHAFLTEALEEMNKGTPSSLYQRSDILLSIERLEVNHPGLIRPNVVKVHVELEKTMSSMIREIFQNAVVRVVSLLCVGSLIPFLLKIA